MRKFEAIMHLRQLQDRLRRQVRLERYYREAEDQNPPKTMVINGVPYALAPREPGFLLAEIRALETAIVALRDSALHAALRKGAQRR